MQIRLPRALVVVVGRSMDVVVAALLPPPRRVGLTLLGVEVTWSDVGLLAWLIVISAAIVWYTANPWWAAVLLGVNLAGWVFMPPLPDKEKKSER